MARRRRAGVLRVRWLGLDFARVLTLQPHAAGVHAAPDRGSATPEPLVGFSR
jgi:hypothetical protein